MFDPGSILSCRGAPELVFARTCYDHLAGELAVALLNRLLERDLIQEHGRDYQLNMGGEQFFAYLGIDVKETARKRRRFAYPCLDWSQLVPHLGRAIGGLGS